MPAPCVFWLGCSRERLLTFFPHSSASAAAASSPFVALFLVLVCFALAALAASRTSPPLFPLWVLSPPALVFCHWLCCGRLVASCSVAPDSFLASLPLPLCSLHFPSASPPPLFDCALFTARSASLLLILLLWSLPPPTPPLPALLAGLPGLLPPCSTFPPSSLSPSSPLSFAVLSFSFAPAFRCCTRLLDSPDSFRPLPFLCPRFVYACTLIFAPLRPFASPRLVPRAHGFPPYSGPIVFFPPPSLSLGLLPSESSVPSALRADPPHPGLLARFVCPLFAPGHALFALALPLLVVWSFFFPAACLATYPDLGFPFRSPAPPSGYPPRLCLASAVCPALRLPAQSLSSGGP